MGRGGVFCESETTLQYVQPVTQLMPAEEERGGEREGRK